MGFGQWVVSLPIPVLGNRLNGLVHGLFGFLFYFVLFFMGTDGVGGGKHGGNPKPQSWIEWRGILGSQTTLNPSNLLKVTSKFLYPDL